MWCAQVCSLQVSKFVLPVRRFKICGITHAISSGFPANHSDFASHVISRLNLLVPNFYVYFYVCRIRLHVSLHLSNFLPVFVFFPFILDIKFVGRTSRGRTGGRSHRISHPPSFCGACLNFSREKDSAIPFPRRP